MKQILFEAAHSFIIHGQFVPPEKTLKWVETLDSALSVIDNPCEDTKKSLSNDLNALVFEPIRAIAEAYRIYVGSEAKALSKSHSEATVGLVEAARRIDEAIKSAVELAKQDPVQAKRNLLGAINHVIDTLIQSGKKNFRRIPFTEELFKPS